MTNVVQLNLERMILINRFLRNIGIYHLAYSIAIYCIVTPMSC